MKWRKVLSVVLVVLVGVLFPVSTVPAGGSDLVDEPWLVGYSNSAGGVSWQSPVAGYPSGVMVAAIYGRPVVSIAWDFGDGTAETTYTIWAEHVWNVGGSYWVEARVTERDGSYTVSGWVGVYNLWEGPAFTLNSTWWNNDQTQVWDVSALAGSPNARAVAFSLGSSGSGLVAELDYCGNTQEDFTRVYVNEQLLLSTQLNPGCAGWRFYVPTDRYFDPTPQVAVKLVVPNNGDGTATLHADYGVRILWTSEGVNGVVPVDPVEPDETSSYNVVVNGGRNQVAVLIDARGENAKRLTFEADGQWKGWHGVYGDALVELWEERPSGEWVLVASASVHRIGNYDVSPQSCGNQWPWSVE